MELIYLLEKDLKLLSPIKCVVHMLFNKLIFNIIEISIFSQIPYYKQIEEKTEQHSKHKFIYEHVSKKSED